MAGDWIKLRGNLWDDPRIAAICDACECGEASAIGALYWLWATADQHTEDGLMPGLTVRQIDRKTGVAGFGEALVAIGWIECGEEGIILARFDEHNGASAKRRCADAQRKASIRSVSASDADKARTEEGQKAPDCGAREREEKSNTSSLRSDVGRASRLPKDWSLPDDWRDWAKAERSDIDPIKTADQFRDYWTAKPGKDGRKVDWLATWRNWVRSQRAQQPIKTQHAFAPPFQNRKDRQLETAGLLTGAVRQPPKPLEVIDAESRIIPS